MRKLKNVTILGAGTAGWISAYILSDFFYTNKQNVKVTIVDPSSIPIIGVGEGTTGATKLITTSGSPSVLIIDTKYTCDPSALTELCNGKGKSLTNSVTLN